MKIEWTIVGVLAVWRITHLLAHEDGPFDLVFRARAALGDHALGRVLDCFYCLSLWVALPIALLIEPGSAWAWLLWPALSGGAVLLERVTTRAEPTKEE